MQLALKGDVAIRSAVAFEFPQMQRGKQEWIQVEVADGNFTVERQRIRETQGGPAGDGAFAHGGVELEVCELPVRLEIAAEAADNFPADLSIHDTERAGGQRGGDPAAGFQAERQ